MPINSKILKKHFGEKLPEIIKEVNEYLYPLGLQAFRFGDEYVLQFDLTQLARSEKGQLLYYLMVTPKESSNSDKEAWEYTGLSENEKAAIMAALACAKKFHSDIFSIDSLKDILMPQQNTSLMTKGQFDHIISTLKRKKYLKKGPTKDTLAIGWRLQIELSMIEKDNPEDVEELLDEIDRLNADVL
ncbi:MAG: hypothetical protein ACXADY_20665 [Candidatus Hodarchaeales archaeon]|jgi:hypothetical protein